jgi:2-polyprenyl-3-methyl-5-hydroxy-6-metoxy-1,4-benzoquinol methylase
MTWEETIDHIRSNDAYASLVDQAYLHQDLSLNVQRFSDSDEFKETLIIIEAYLKKEKVKMLDVGCGNGISSVAFALHGFEVTAIDPDPSESVGTGAVKKLKEQYGLKNLTIFTCTAEEFITSESFDIIYCRQAMHHANNLLLFVQNTTKFLKQGGLLFTVRDHVIYNAIDKKRFLREHPLHKFYHGENAFTSNQYKSSIVTAGLVLKEMKYYDSVINFYPLTLGEVTENTERERQLILKNLSKYFGWIGRQPFMYWLYTKFWFDPEALRNESSVAGRMYSYLSIKK